MLSVLLLFFPWSHYTLLHPELQAQKHHFDPPFYQSSPNPDWILFKSKVLAGSPVWIASLPFSGEENMFLNFCMTLTSLFWRVFFFGLSKLPNNSSSWFANPSSYCLLCINRGSRKHPGFLHTETCWIKSPLFKPERNLFPGHSHPCPTFRNPANYAPAKPAMTPKNNKGRWVSYLL